MAEKERKEELKNLDIKSEVESLSIHGIPRIASSNTASLKLMWSCSCLLAVAVLVYCSAISIQRHLRHEVYTNVERKEDENIALPAVTFCNAKTLEYTATSEANYSYPEKQDLPKNCSFTGLQYFKNEINQQNFIQACRWFSGNHSFSEMENIARVGRYKTEFIEFPKHFSFMPNIWPCFTLNPNQTLRQNGVGELAGIRMIIQSDESDPHRKILDSLDDDRHGLFINIHDGREHMNGLRSISLPVGFHTSIEISKTIMKRKPAPFPSNCLKAGGSNGGNIFPGKETMESCRLSCFHKIVHRRCNGVYPPMRTFMKADEYPGFININDEKSVKCFHDVINYMSECKCRVPCEMERYETKVTRTPWPEEAVGEKLYDVLYKGNSHNKTVKAAKIKKFLKVSIYYSSLSKFVHTEEEKYGPISILSDFGGQMGLLIGASFLSFIEIISLITKCCINFFRTKKQKRIGNTF